MSLEKLFKSLQNEMMTSLGVGSELVHPVDKGDLSEKKWLHFLEKYLPKRYSLSKGTAIDHEGNTSQQNDLVIYDNLYAPLVFNEGGIKYIPVESIYAVFEVKPEINKEYIQYAAEKVERVRKLKRTSAIIKHAGGTYDPIKEEDMYLIIGGILGKDGWTDFSKKIKENISPLKDKQILDIGCCLSRGSFVNDGKGNMTIGDSECALISFFTQLHEMLRIRGTASPLDINKYYQFK